jgi:hypothetical protein
VQKNLPARSAVGKPMAADGSRFGEAGMRDTCDNIDLESRQAYFLPVRQAGFLDSFVSFSYPRLPKYLYGGQEEEKEKPARPCSAEATRRRCWRANYN